MLFRNPNPLPEDDAIAMFKAQVSTFGLTSNPPTIVGTDTINARTVTGTASSIVPTTLLKILGRVSTR
jgi:hypothetical protein